MSGSLPITEQPAIPGRSPRRFDWTFLLGFDFFISYRRDRGKEYALSLFNALEAKGYYCFLDQEETEGGVLLNESLQSALSRSRVLLVIAEPRIVRSAYVREEVRQFVGLRRDIHPINIAGFLKPDGDLPTPLRALIDFTWTDETASAFKKGVPTPTVIDSICKAAKRLRLRTVSRIITIATVALLAAAAVVAVWQRFQALAERDEAVRQQTLAEARLYATESERERSSASRSVELSALLARESLDTAPTEQGRSALYRALDLLPRPPLQDFSAVPTSSGTPSRPRTFVSPDGVYLAAIVTDQLGERLALWNVAEGGLITTTRLDSASRPIWGADTLYLPVASDEMQRWQLPSGEPLPRLRLDGLGRILSVDDAGRFAVGIREDPEALWLGWSAEVHEEGPRGPLLVWDVTNGQRVLEIPIEHRIKAAWFYGHEPRQRLRVVSGHRDTTFYEEYSLPDGSLKRLRVNGGAGIVRPGPGYTGVAFVNGWFHVFDGKWSRTESLSIYSSLFLDSELVRIHHLAPVRDALFSRDGKVIASHSEDNRVRVSEAETGGARLDLAHDRPIAAMALSENGSLLAFADDLNDVHIWDTRAGRQLLSIGVAEDIANLAFIDNGATLGVVTTAGRVRVWRATGGAELAVVYSEDRWMDLTDRLDFGPAGSYLALIREPVALLNLSVPSLSPLAGAGDTREATFSADKRRLATVGDGHVRVFDLAASELVNEIEMPPEGRALLGPDAQWMVQIKPGGSDGPGGDAEDPRSAVVGVELASGRQLWKLETEFERPQVYFRGRLVVVFDGDRLKVVDVSSGAPLAARAIEGGESALITTTDTLGASLAAGGSQIEVWRLRDGRTIHILPIAERIRQWGLVAASGRRTDQVVTRLELSPDGTRLLLELNEARLTLWSLPGLRFLGETEAKDSYAGFGPRGHYVVLHDSKLFTKSRDRIWGTGAGIPTDFQFAAPLGNTSAAIHPDGDHIAVQDSETTASIWHLGERRRIARIETHCELERGEVAFSPDGRLLITVCEGDWISFWHWRAEDLCRDVELRLGRQLTSEERRIYLGFGEPAKVPAAQPPPAALPPPLPVEEQLPAVDRGQQLAVRERQLSAARERGASTPELVAIIPRASGDAKILGSSGYTLVRGGEGGVAIHRVGGGVLARWANAVLRGLRIGGGFEVRLSDPLTAASIDLSERWLALAGGNAVEIWDLNSQERLAQLVHDSRVQGVQFDADGKYLATRDRATRVWLAEDWIEIAKLDPQRFERSPTGRYNAKLSREYRVHNREGYSESTLKVRDARSGNLAITITDGGEDSMYIESVAFSPDDRFVAVGFDEGWVWVFDIEADRRVLKVRDDTWDVAAVAFSPDAKLLASAEEQVASVWAFAEALDSLPAGEAASPLLRLEHEQTIRTLAFSPDGELLITASGDAARLWNVESGILIAEYRHEEAVLELSFSRDGHFLATRDQNGSVSLWQW